MTETVLQPQHWRNSKWTSTDRCEPWAREAGFTLLELLIVIAILAILAGLLFPVFAKSRARARTAACGQQAHQLGLALVMYSQDYDSVAPRVYVLRTTHPKVELYWQVMVLPYAANERVFICPAAHRRRVVWSTRRNFFTTSYGMNLVGRAPALSADFAGNLAMSSAEGVHESAVESPADTIWIIDASSRWVNYDPDDAHMGMNTAAQPWHNSPRIAKRHSEGLNALFVDGHVKWLRQVRGAMWTRTAD